MRSSTDMAIETPTTPYAAAAIGARVKVRLASGAVRAFLLVFDHGNPEVGTISSNSPLGKALLNRCAGETASYRVGSNVFTVTLLAINPHDKRE